MVGGDVALMCTVVQETQMDWMDREQTRTRAVSGQDLCGWAWEVTECGRWILPLGSGGVVTSDCLGEGILAF